MYNFSSSELLEKRTNDSITIKILRNTNFFVKPTYKHKKAFPFTGYYYYRGIEFLSFSVKLT